MWYIFSAEREKKEFGQAVEAAWENCRTIVPFHLTLKRHWVCLFFVRIFVYSDVWALTCRGCGVGHEVRGRELENAKDGCRAHRQIGKPIPV